MQIVSIGEVLWDVFPREELLGGAPLNFCVTAQRLGHPVTLLTAVGADTRGSRALAVMEELGLSTQYVQTTDRAPTGTAVVSTDRDGNATFVIERPAAFDLVTLDEPLLRQLERENPEWIYFGTLAQAGSDGGNPNPSKETENEALLHRLIARLPRVRRFYDMNLREGHWSLPLVERLSAMATVLKLNDAEAHILFRLAWPGEEFSFERFCCGWSQKYGMEIICVTMGGKGCLIYEDGELHSFPGFAIRVVDTVGAGDAFAAAFLHGLIENWPMAKKARYANAVGAVIASRAGAIPKWTTEEVERLLTAG